LAWQVGLLGEPLTNAIRERRGLGGPPDAPRAALRGVIHVKHPGLVPNPLDGVERDRGTFGDLGGWKARFEQDLDLMAFWQGRHVP